MLSAFYFFLLKFCLLIVAVVLGQAFGLVTRADAGTLAVVACWTGIAAVLFLLLHFVTTTTTESN